MNAPADAVVLAVGPDGTDAAARWAVAEAMRREHPLHLVHVLPLPENEAVLATAEATLGEVQRAAELLAAGEVTVTAELVDHGGIVDQLVRCSVGASLLVLQHRHPGKVRRVFDGSVGPGVAGRAQVGVVSVPGGWQPRTGSEPVVVAGVQDPLEASALLRAAFEQARARRASLVVVHAWWLLNSSNDVVVDAALRDEWSAQSRQEIMPVLEPLERQFFSVPVTVTVRHAPPVEAVLDEAIEADLLVLGRRHHLLPLGSHLGPVARGALEHAACPVMLTPEPASPGSAGPSETKLARPTNDSTPADA